MFENLFNKNIQKEGFIIVTCVTLDEDEEDILENIREYNSRLSVFDVFENNLTQYLLYDKRADEDTFKLWKALEQDIAKASNSDVMSDNKVCLITWLESNWRAFLECILDNNFKYMNVASIVLQTWIEFCN